MSEKPKTCSNCWSSMFRRKHGETQLYCGYWYKPVELDGICDMHNKQISGGTKYQHVKVNSRFKPVFVKKEDDTVATFGSIMKAAAHLGVSQSAFSMALSRGRNKIKGYEIGYINQ